MVKPSRQPEPPAKADAIELAEDRLDLAAGANGLFRYYGDVNGDRTTPRPPQIKAG